MNEFMDITKSYLRLLEEIQEGSKLNFLSIPSKEDEDLIASLGDGESLQGFYYNNNNYYSI